MATECTSCRTRTNAAFQFCPACGTPKQPYGAGKGGKGSAGGKGNGKTGGGKPWRGGNHEWQTKGGTRGVVGRHSGSHRPAPPPVSFVHRNQYAPLSQEGAPLPPPPLLPPLSLAPPHQRPTRPNTRPLALTCLNASGPPSPTLFPPPGPAGPQALVLSLPHPTALLPLHLPQYVTTHSTYHTCTGTGKGNTREKAAREADMTAKEEEEIKEEREEEFLKRTKCIGRLLRPRGSPLGNQRGAVMPPLRRA